MIKPIEDALKKIPNRFLLTTVIARRWENIVAGAPELVDRAAGESTLEVVLKEIIEDRIELDREERMINLVGLPEEEESSETTFSEGFVPDAEGVKLNLPQED